MHNRKKLFRRILYTVIILLVLCTGVMLVYLGDYYRSDADALSYLADTEEVKVQDFTYGTFFDGPGSTNALIFYPGAKVETTAYAPVMRMLAENGIDCFLIDMPFHMAFFGMNRAGDIMELYSYENWYLGGHSLGGAMAANYAADHTDRLTGLFLLAAYPTKDLSGSNLKVLTVYGSNDGVLHMDKVAKGRALLPENREEIEIEGGNHAQFGSYGKQKGDGEASISKEEQWAQTVNAFLKMADPVK